MARDLEQSLLTWVVDISRGSARKLLKATLPFFQVCAWHDGENVNTHLHAKVHDNTSHRPLTKLYHAVLNGTITPAQYEELAPRSTPQPFKYLRENQFSSAFLPRLDRRISALVDKPPGDTNNVAEHAHSTVKREGIPVASGETVEHMVGTSTGNGSDGFSGRLLADYIDVCTRLDDRPVYAARDALEDTLKRIVSDHALSLKPRPADLLAADSGQNNPFIRDVTVSMLFFFSMAQ